MQLIRGDITEVKRGIVCHQVNCQGVMGAGVALQIRNKFPKAYTDYKTAHRNGLLILGNCIFSLVGEDLIIANLCGQNRYGRDKQYTDYSALRKSLLQVRSMQDQTKLPVFIPGMMGCSLGGGDWPTVKKLIELIVPDANIVFKGMNVKI